MNVDINSIASTLNINANSFGKIGKITTSFSFGDDKRTKNGLLYTENAAFYSTIRGICINTIWDQYQSFGDLLKRRPDMVEMSWEYAIITREYRKTANGPVEATERKLYDLRNAAQLLDTLIQEDISRWTAWQESLEMNFDALDIRAAVEKHTSPLNVELKTSFFPKNYEFSENQAVYASDGRFVLVTECKGAAELYPTPDTATTAPQHTLRHTMAA